MWREGEEQGGRGREGEEQGGKGREGEEQGGREEGDFENNPNRR